MDLERWKQVDSLLQSVLELKPEERETFLGQACADDSALEREVRSLLALEQKAGSFLQTPVLEAAPREPSGSFSGKTIAHYRVIEKLGDGGMGTVWKAFDTHLNRTVAIKALSSEAVADADRRQRFIQEARAASALDHPNIITIHDIAEFDGQHFIVMQYVAGKTLRALLQPGGLPLKEALEYAIQTADALAQAHARGIIHRDLKPENVMVTGQGQVKILDFGLAKLTDRDNPPELPATQSLKQNEAVRTEQGVILGTVAYMSPEQAEGKRVDARSDIFSFGSLLYEMLTGRRAFQGGTSIAVASAVLHQEPPSPRETVEGIPPEAEKLISRCLRKDRERRIQHMDDVKIELEDLNEDLLAGRTPQVSSPKKEHRARLLTLVAAAAVVLVSSGATFTWWLTRPHPPAPLQPLVRLTADDGLSTDPSISQDGKMVAYASDRSGEGNLDIWVQQIAGGQPIRLTRNPTDEREPSFSHDGSRIVFSSDRDGGGVYVMPALGGEPKLIARRGHRARFSPDDEWVAYEVGEKASGDPSAEGLAQIYIVPSAGGTPRQIHPEFAALRNPVWSPDRKHILFWGATKTNPSVIDWWVAPLEGGPPVRTFAVDALRVLRNSSYWRPEDWSADQGVLFSDAVVQGADISSVFAIALSPRTWRSTGPIRRLTFGTGLDSAPSLAASDGEFARLVFASLTSRRNIWAIPVDANQGKVKGEIRQLTHGATPLDNPSLSSDAKLLTFSAEHSENGDIWIQDLQTGAASPLAATASDEFYPILSPDGSRVAYRADGAARHKLLAVPSRGGLAEELSSDCYHAWSWSNDHSSILYWPTGTARAQINVLNLSSGEKAEFLTHSKYSLYQAFFSPDDHWVVFLAHTGPSNRGIYIVPYHSHVAPSESAWIPITDGQWDDKPRWSPDGNIIYFVSDRDGFRCVWAQRLEPLTKRPIGMPFGIYHFHHARQSLMNVGLGSLEISVGIDKIVLNLPDSTGSIWMTRVEGQK